MMAVEVAGAVYCPLSPRDPRHRLHTLVQQTQSRLVLVHWLTKQGFHRDITSLDIHSILMGNEPKGGVNVHQLSHVITTAHSTAYIIFTSGSTGTPKAVC